MALQLLALRFLLVLLSPLPAQGQEEPDPKVQGVPWKTGKKQFFLFPGEILLLFLLQV